jgi:UDP-glucose:(glucosyl)LPS alpha-1,2-glucosyltransferase
MAATNMDLINKSGFEKAPKTFKAPADPNLNNQDLIELNELNQASNGGTELTTRKLFDCLTREELEDIQIITARVRELDENRIRIYHLHDLPLDPEASHLKEESSRNRFHKLVFSSNWQYQQYQNYLGVPYSNHSMVIETGIDPIPLVEKPKDKIRLIYTSTPHRGLEILVPVFVELAKRNPDIELDVFSSFGIYGPGWEGRDAQYEPLFKICREHPQINYHGWADQETVRAAYQKAHILAYPCIWPETSCRSLIEAMSAGCLAVHPNFSALSDTAGGLTLQYGGDSTDINVHANIFAHTLMYAIENMRVNDMTPLLSYVKSYADMRFGWDNIAIKWKSLIASLKAEHNDFIKGSTES